MPENDREIVALWNSICAQITGVVELLGTPTRRQRSVPNTLNLVKQTVVTEQQRSTHRKQRDYPAC